MLANGARIDRVAFVGNYLPRQCGIATFTTDLCEAVAAAFPETACFAVPVNDTPEGYDYPPAVRFELIEQDIRSYKQAANFLNLNDIDLVCLQHEYGIFGGLAGSHILTLLRDLRMPIVTTLHTVLQNPDSKQRWVMEELARLSGRLVVMSQRALDFLQDVYRIPRDKIDFVPHGIPDVPFVDPNFYKDLFHVEGKLVMLTFGLLAPNKGIEHTIRALPQILERYPNVVYIVLGATHPHVKRSQGEAYRTSLEELADELGVGEHVIFHNRFVDLEELVKFIGAADIYVTPYLNKEQITSGTLAYTLGAGKAIVSTPYWYAEELLAEGRGLLVPIGDPAAIAEKVLYLLDHEAERHAMRKRAYSLGRQMIWSEVARRYMESFARARSERVRYAARLHAATTQGAAPGTQLPQIKLDHLKRMTDGTGLLQHAIFTVPRYSEGYTTDDNARALVLTVLLERVNGEMTPDVRELAARYLAFLWHAFDPETNRFRNELSYDQRWVDGLGSEDSHARAIWAAGMILGHAKNAGFQGLAGQLLERALAPVLGFTSPRAWAFTLIGLNEYLRPFSGDRVVKGIRNALARRLYDQYRRYSSHDWPWFENIVAYSNAKLAHAMLLSGEELSDEMVDAGLKALSWLLAIQTSKDGHFVPIGNQGFYRRGGEKARFDQQPVEANALISACLEAHRITGQRRWREAASRVFDWFLGHNDLGLALYDPHTGGCYDGLHPDRVNRNQGAESTLSCLLSLTEMRLAEKAIQMSVVVNWS